MIEIKKETTLLHSGQFDYKAEDVKIVNYRDNRSRIYCSKCGSSLKNVYTYIITSLYNNGLLSTDFDSLCCGCYMRRKIAKIEEKLNANNNSKE